MRVSDALEWLSALDGDAELAVTAAFPELDGWEVTSWALRPGAAAAGLAAEIRALAEVYGR